MRQVADGIHRLGSRHHNFYILAEGGKATVIDTGGTKEWPDVIAGLAALGMTADAVEAVLITHDHSDHIGGAEQASKDRVEVRVHEAEAARATGNAPQTQVGTGDLPLWKPAVWTFLVAMVRAGAARTPRLAHVETFTDGEVLDLPGRPRAIYTPGHTEGHSAFHIEAKRVLFSGDALVTRNLLGGRTGPQILDDRFHADPAQARASLARLAGLGTDLVLPGHGEPWAGDVGEAVAAMGG